MLSIELRARKTTAKVIWVNLISVVINIILAISGFYFAFINDSSATGAFAADCVLDFVSSAIVLWRYFGDLTSEFAHIREQIACLYLGALFELSALAIIIKAIKDITDGDPVDHTPEMGYFQQPSDGSTELVFLASAATLACLILTLFKCSLYRELKDNSILLDVINTLISSVFAISIVMSQVLISIDSSFWYLDPVLSIVLAIFMMAFGIKVLHQNIGLLKRHSQYEQTHLFADHDANDDHHSPAIYGRRSADYITDSSAHQPYNRYQNHYHNSNLTASYDHHLHIVTNEKALRRQKIIDQNNNNNNNNNNDGNIKSCLLNATTYNTNQGFKRSNYGTNLSLSTDRGQSRPSSTFRAILTGSNSNNNLEVDLTSSSYHRQIFHDHDHHKDQDLTPNNQASSKWTRSHYPNILIR